MKLHSYGQSTTQAYSVEEETTNVASIDESDTLEVGSMDKNLSLNCFGASQ